ncbi:MAG TPA: ECF transporter S component [Candidatus Dormibacteraeota bacterium]
MRLILVSAVGLALFLWPFFGWGATAADGPAFALALACALGLLAIELGTRELDARRLALLAALAAIDAGLRMALVTGIGGFSPIFFLVLCAGWVFGPSYGFLVGSFSLLVSALATGGIGPWVPYQVFAVGWVGAVAGLAGRFRQPRFGWRDALVLAAVGAIMGWVFGALMDIQVWVNGFRGSDAGWTPGAPVAVSLVHFWRFYVLTSLAYDTFRAAGSAAMVVLLGAPVVAALERVRMRFTAEILPA